MAHWKAVCWLTQHIVTDLLLLRCVHLDCLGLVLLQLFHDLFLYWFASLSPFDSRSAELLSSRVHSGGWLVAEFIDDCNHDLDLTLSHTYDRTSINTLIPTSINDCHTVKSWQKIFHATTWTHCWLRDSAFKLSSVGWRINETRMLLKQILDCVASTALLRNMCIKT